MHVKAEAMLDFGWGDEEADNQTVRDYRDEYKTLSEILEGYPTVRDLAHVDLQQLSQVTSPQGRKPIVTSRFV